MPDFVVPARDGLSMAPFFTAVATRLKRYYNISGAFSGEPRLNKVPVQQLVATIERGELTTIDALFDRLNQDDLRHDVTLLRYANDIRAGLTTYLCGQGGSKNALMAAMDSDPTGAALTILLQSMNPLTDVQKAKIFTERDRANNNTLMYAIEFCSNAVEPLLAAWSQLSVEAQIMLFTQCNFDSNTALMLALLHRHPMAERLLVLMSQCPPQLRVNTLSHTNYRGLNALEIALRSSSSETVNLVIEAIYQLPADKHRAISSRSLAYAVVNNPDAAQQILAVVNQFSSDIKFEIFSRQFEIFSERLTGKMNVLMFAVLQNSPLVGSLLESINTLSHKLTFEILSQIDEGDRNVLIMAAYDNHACVELILATMLRFTSAERGKMLTQYDKPYKFNALMAAITADLSASVATTILAFIEGHCYTNAKFDTLAQRSRIGNNALTLAARKKNSLIERVLDALSGLSPEQQMTIVNVINKDGANALDAVKKKQGIDHPSYQRLLSVMLKLDPSKAPNSLSAASSSVAPSVSSSSTPISHGFFQYAPLSRSVSFFFNHSGLFYESYCLSPSRWY